MDDDIRAAVVVSESSIMTDMAPRKVLALVLHLNFILFHVSGGRTKDFLVERRSRLGHSILGERITISHQQVLSKSQG